MGRQVRGGYYLTRSTAGDMPVSKLTFTTNKNMKKIINDLPA